MYSQTAVTIEGTNWNTVVDIPGENIVFVITIKYMYFLNKIAMDCWLCSPGHYVASINLSTKTTSKTVRWQKDCQHLYLHPSKIIALNLAAGSPVYPEWAKRHKVGFPLLSISPLRVAHLGSGHYPSSVCHQRRLIGISSSSHLKTEVQSGGN